MRFDSQPRSLSKVRTPPQLFYLNQHHLGLVDSSAFVLADRHEFRRQRAFEHWLIQREVVFRVGRSLGFEAQTELLSVDADGREKQGDDKNIYQKLV